MIKEWYNSYNVTNQDESLKAKREIIQYITLSGLSRSDFFSKASYYGGTALRMLYGLPRFSEDIDFSLNYSDPNFSLKDYFTYIEKECDMHGLAVDLSVKDKVHPNDVESAFLKDNTEWNIISVQEKNSASIKIKIEIDRNPPLFFETEPKLILRPFSFYINTFKESYLFAGKMHAFLFREWKTRVKGRDWYDLEWYVKRGTPLNLRHLQERAIQSNHLNKDIILNKELLNEIIIDKISKTDIKMALIDIERFIQNPSDLNIWSKQYFYDLANMIKYE
ncbi:MAG: nucleotidyl transferase AbiEii/AbiGii toxin family protein [Saprospiraceae bacterium]|nr:nucleotidyl transferase AbiEii/AbiGii toxin family protein [Saprospiraceae bacterium]